MQGSGASSSMPAAGPLRGTSPTDESALATHILRQWAWGELSASNVQQLAMHAYNDQAELLKSLGLSPDLANPHLFRLARLGSWGKHASNIHSQLLTYLGDPMTPPYFAHTVPMILPKAKTFEVSTTTAAAQSKFPSSTDKGKPWWIRISRPRVANRRHRIHQDSPWRFLKNVWHGGGGYFYRPYKAIGLASGSDPDPEPMVDCGVPFFLPHVLFSWFFHENKQRFSSIFLGDCQHKAQIKAFGGRGASAS